MFHSIWQRLLVLCLLSLLIACRATQLADISDGELRPGADAAEDIFDTSTKNQPPKPVVRIAKEFPEAEEVTVKVEAQDPDSSELTFMYDWDGNGIFDKVTNRSVVKHRWLRDGKWKVHVRVQDTQGGIGDDFVDVVVKDRAPTARFKMKDSIHEGEWTSFDAKASTTPNDPIVNYEWDWNYNGKDFRPQAKGRKVEQRWLQSGSYQVALRVTDTDGSSHIVTKPLTVLDQAPVAKISGPNELQVGQPGSFSGLASRSVADRIVGYYWDTDFNGVFKQRLPSSRTTIKKSWQAPGLYRIGLQVRDSDGSTTLAVHKVRVVAIVPPSKPADAAKSRR